MTRKHTNNQMQKKPNDFGLKYGNQKNITRRLNGEQYDKRTRKARRNPENGNTHLFTQNYTKNILNWKTPGHDVIHGFWFKRFTPIHDRPALEMNWMTKGRTALIQKDPSQGTAPNNYRPITCLPMMWKIFTAQIREEIYYLLIRRGLFPEEHKECHKDPGAQQS